MSCEYIANYLTAAIALFGFAVTIYTLLKNNKEKSIANVIALKAEFREYDGIYIKLLPECEWANLPPDYFTRSKTDNKDKDKNKCGELGILYSYLGLFEVAYLMVKNKILTEDEFEIFFLYRLTNISNNTAIMNHINSDHSSWNNLLKLMRMFELNR